MPFIKGKSMQEKAENEQNKLRMKRIKLAEMETDVEMRSLRARMSNPEVQRLRS